MPHQCTNCGRTFADGSKEMLSGCPDCGGNKFQFQPSGKGGERSAERSGTSANDATNPESAPATKRTEKQRTEPGVNRDRSELSRNADSDNHGVDATTDTSSDPIADSTADSIADTTTDESAKDSAAKDTDSEGAEYQTTTTQENQAQRDARSSPTTKEEIEEARRELAETEQEQLSNFPDQNDTAQRPKRGRGTPQGPPPEPPDEEAAEEFSLSGAVGPPEDQPSSSETSERNSEEETIQGPNTDLSALRDELNDQFESIKITAPGQYELNLMELYDRKEYIISLQEDGRYVVDIPEGHNLDE